MTTAHLASCPVCTSASRSVVLDLPAFPLTGIYVANPSCHEPTPDQNLLLCDNCGHGYLQNVIDPNLLYDESYTHRTGISPMARASNDVFWSFIQKQVAGRTFDNILEIGCNDLYLMERLQTIGRHAIGLDPVWRNIKPEITWPHVKVIGKFIGELDTAADLETPPDLIVSAHTFEHLAYPTDELRSVVGKAAPNAMFIIAVPGFDGLLANHRFDQVFHQHIQYFSLASAVRMIKELGCHYLDHGFDYECWGGTLMFSFSKMPTSKNLPKISRPLTTDVKQRVDIFKNRLSVYGQEIMGFDGPVYGFGAAQMLPCLAYHLGASFQKLTAILDDNPDRIGRFFPACPVPIVSPASVQDIASSAMMITALDSARPIMKRLLELRPRSIFYPLAKI